MHLTYSILARDGFVTKHLLLPINSSAALLSYYVTISFPESFRKNWHQWRNFIEYVNTHSHLRTQVPTSSRFATQVYNNIFYLIEICEQATDKIDIWVELMTKHTLTLILNRVGNVYIASTVMSPLFHCNL